MKKYCAILIMMLLTGYSSLAQIQRNPVKQKKDSLAVAPAAEKKIDSRKEIFKELNLTQEQKMKLKEINQSMKASRETIESDSTLSEADKKAKLRTLRKEHGSQVQALLTEEQKIKFRELKEKNGIE